MTAAKRVTPEWMQAWGEHATTSPLYFHLVKVIAESPDLMRVINRIENDPPPNLLFGAVHFLLMKGQGRDLAAFYPSLEREPRPVAKVDGTFTEFVLANEREIVEIGSTRLTQTNECRRCAALLPAIMGGPFDRFHLVEVGTSAGLNLALDMYHYRWGDLEWGPRSSVSIESELRGLDPRPREIEVLGRFGLDLNPIDASDPDQRRWLEALIWPEHHERRSRLSAALDLIGEVPIQFVAGDALETLGPALDDVPGDDPVVVMSSFLGLQLTTEQHQALDDIVAAHRSMRPMFRVSMEGRVRGETFASVVVDDGHGARQVASAQHHGEWVELYA